MAPSEIFAATAQQPGRAARPTVAQGLEIVRQSTSVVDPGTRGEPPSMSAIGPILIASDHAGVDLKTTVAHWLETHGHAVVDLGTDGDRSVDYPDFADAMADAIRQGTGSRGILICGTGIGIAMAANRHRAVRAAVCHDVTTVRLARGHNDANVLALGARIVGAAVALDCVDAFLSTDYDGGRHDRRLAKLGPLGG